MPNPASLGELTGRHVLIVDDVAGSGDTMYAARKQVDIASAARIRTLVCAVNDRKWPATRRAPEDAFTAIGLLTGGWVTFPWEPISPTSTEQQAPTPIQESP